MNPSGMKYRGLKNYFLLEILNFVISLILWLLYIHFVGMTREFYRILPTWSKNESSFYVRLKTKWCRRSAIGQNWKSAMAETFTSSEVTFLRSSLQQCQCFYHVHIEVSVMLNEGHASNCIQWSFVPFTTLKCYSTIMWGRWRGLWEIERDEFNC